MIMGNREFLVESELSAEQRGVLRSIDVAGGGLLSLINDILDMSKIGAGKFCYSMV
jgi:signal transduction histidine kinase